MEGGEQEGRGRRDGGRSWRELEGEGEREHG
jgi:hypothetical protein